MNCKASEYIDNIIDFVQGLIDKGYAYPTPDGNVYYSVRRNLKIMVNYHINKLMIY